MQQLAGGPNVMNQNTGSVNSQSIGGYRTTVNAEHLTQGSNNVINNQITTVARDSLNITNSLIISNSQILFQDMGNGKIIPMHLN
jgi:hypothetical protein